ncbi:MAG: hypothetical protein H6Q61_1299, partial [Firmicutes bacterium]|nr:hypothetical protein [Bacillota bacterium]
ASALESSGFIIMEKKEQNGWVAFVCRLR